MHPAYKLLDEAEVPSPSLVFHPSLIAKNIATVIQAAGGPERLRPHVKTHKTIEIAKMQLASGITKHKCATIAEAEMLAMAGAPDVLIAYPMVGPNVGRLASLKKKYPGTQFSSLIDHKVTADMLSEGMTHAGLKGEFVVDIDVGMHRTGIALEKAGELYTYAAKLPNLVPGGLQSYDGHNHASARTERDAVVNGFLDPVLHLRETLLKQGLPVPRLIGGGTPSFPVYADHKEIPFLECSPGTFVLYDAGYGSRYTDLENLVPAAVILTRVVSRPTATRVTLDVGNKSVAADPALERRVKLLDFPEYTPVTHSEEHYTVETAGAEKYKPGDVVYALPGHVCPTVALHREVLTAENNRIVGKWKVLSRDRFITI